MYFGDILVFHYFGLLQIQNELDANQLETKLQQSNFSKLKISAIITECLTFNPFYPLEKKDKRFESIELDSKTYLNKLSSIIPKKQSELLKEGMHTRIL